MKIYKGETGLNKSWQGEFPKETLCVACGMNARIMFVGLEGEESVPAKDFICNIHENGKDGKYWLHDACAVAVYLCEQCFETTAIVNQA